MKNKRCRRYDLRSGKAQKGVTLLIALIALVSMTLAAVALVRSVDTTTLIAGNLAFKQGALSVSDRAVGAATNVLVELLASESGGYQHDEAKAYYATSQDGIDFTGNKDTEESNDFDWENKSVLYNKDDGLGNEIRYVIHRLCENTGSPDDPESGCMSIGTSSPSKNQFTRRVLDYSEARDLSAESIYGGATTYRVTVRVVGPRNTVAYTQTILY